MKKAMMILTATALISSKGYGQALEAPIEMEDYPVDPVVAKYEKATEDFDRTISALRTNPAAAGEVFRLKFRGVDYTIDRSMEKRIPTPGNPPSRITIADLVGSVSAEVRGSMRITVHEEFNMDGSLKSRDWQIDFGVNTKLDTGMEDETGKAHK